MKNLFLINRGGKKLGRLVDATLVFRGRRRAPIGRRGAAMGYWLWARDYSRTSSASRTRGARSASLEDGAERLWAMRREGDEAMSLVMNYE